MHTGPYEKCSSLYDPYIVMSDKALHARLGCIEVSRFAPAWTGVKQSRMFRSTSEMNREFFHLIF